MTNVKVMVLLTAKAYENQASLTKKAYVAYCAETFGINTCEFVPIPEKIYESTYDIVKCEINFKWNKDAIKDLYDYIEDERIDVVLVCEGPYPWCDDAVTDTIVSAIPRAKVMRYYPTINRVYEFIETEYEEDCDRDE